MSLAVSIALFLLLGLAVLLGGIATWLLVMRGGMLTSIACLPPRSRPRQSSAKNLLPIEKKGERLNIAAGEIFSVRANGRSSYLFNGHDDVFCPLSIDEMEARLPRQFFRCHHGYIVNLAHVRSVKQVGEAGVVELDSLLRRAAPISHGRVGPLRGELAAFRSGAPRAARRAAP